MTTAVQTWTLWVCTNCLMHAANGECGDCHREEGHEGGEPLSLVSYRATLGMGYEEHHEECLRYTLGSDVPGDYECDCEERGFSTSSCDGCGSVYHGDRYAMTEWER
ncbi:hypothetical protein [Streptomyces werraensis]|uniref:hypothetical protein n=1 Tax=Streptomyces werraensis TaxID=68284 RepID=UPI0036FCB3B0